MSAEAIAQAVETESKKHLDVRRQIQNALGLPDHVERQLEKLADLKRHAQMKFGLSKRTRDNARDHRVRHLFEVKMHQWHEVLEFLGEPAACDCMHCQWTRVKS
jgi:hypothetical protein